MFENQIRDFITQELVREAIDADVADDFPLIDSGALDSLGIFQLVTFLEDEIGVSIADEELTPDNFGTIRAIAGLVRTKQVLSEEAMP
jgi:acyl carrier protein